MTLERFGFYVFFISFLIVFSCNKDTGIITEPSNSDTTYVGVKKPNIYIYPSEFIELDVNLNFPQGGFVVESIPEYNDGWHVVVDTSGLINNEFRFLFYEVQVPNLFQHEKGWIIKKENLSNFFRDNLSKIGFLNDEINDFIEYWIPRLDSATEYLIYPQYQEEISSVIELSFSEDPESLLRLFYVIKENSNQIGYLQTPKIPEFKRKGFTVVEWGVIYN